jgi:hypothetical protein
MTLTISVQVNDAANLTTSNSGCMPNNIYDPTICTVLVSPVGAIIKYFI